MKQKLVNAALVIGSIFISLLALEVGLRAYHDEWGYTNFRFPQSNKFGGYNTYDAELGWVPKPGFVGTTVTILENGIRSNGPEEVGKGTDDPILAVGDSYTFGDQVRDSETWPAQLAELRRLAGSRRSNWLFLRESTGKGRHYSGMGGGQSKAVILGFG